ncbi:dipeptidyl peptidase 1-like [Hyalella azteca]|uniref:Dipeptidyl peptidase 1 n=1 Tax=Hyalella azteca TaxID=294128 RepID=A0A979FGU4_HYAAZ|nr:dipeptidyl peptidase 1-like [Hyalella azteca]
MLRLVVLVALAGLCRADLPIDCRFSDAVGTWIVSESARTGDPSLDCSGELGEVVHQKQFTLTYPNLVTDELGNTGTWTLVYNQGFEHGTFCIARRVLGNKTGSRVTRHRVLGNKAGSRVTRRRVLGNKAGSRVTRHRVLGNKAGSRETRRRVLDKKAGSQVTRRRVLGNKAGSQQDAHKPRHLVEEELPGLDEPYKNDLEMIERINSAQNFWTAKAYPQHEQYTKREMLRRGGSRKFRLPAPGKATAEQKARAALLPTSFDWRDVDGVNYVTPVRDQASCGSCYIFASAAMLESRLRIKTNFSRSDILSTQDVVSCSRISEGCAGGFPYLIAGRYAQDQGFVAEECNPYLGEDTATCGTDVSCGRTYVSDYKYLGGYYGGCTEEEMLENLLTEGPLAVGFEVTADFYLYSEGIYVHGVGNVKADFDPFIVVNHAVLVVGYGVDEASGMKYWIVKNSWGQDWGEQGYFRIRRGTNEVGIESLCVSATVIP